MTSWASTGATLSTLVWWIILLSKAQLIPPTLGIGAALGEEEPVIYPKKTSIEQEAVATVVIIKVQQARSEGVQK